MSMENTNTNVPPKIFARVTHLDTNDVFYSDKDDQLTATVKIVNESEIRHACQIVFRGYVRSGKTLQYEFLHEQAWVVAESGESTHEVSVDAWINRFPPTMEVVKDHFIEYCVRATIDPWFLNTHVEKAFVVKRALVLKQPHTACFAYRRQVNECVGHGSLFHRQCNALNGYMLLEKAAYTWGEDVAFKWALDCTSPLREARVSLLKTIEFRDADPGHPMRLEVIKEELVHEQKAIEQGNGSITLRVPEGLQPTIEMSLWNVLAIKYFVLLQIKADASKKWVELHSPLMITSEKLQSKRGDPKEHKDLHKRAHDIDDDSADDDDYDSELEGDDEMEEMREQDERRRGGYSIDIEELRIDTDNGLTEAFCEIVFIINSKIPRSLKSIRFLLTGECRAGPSWFEFLRYKSIVQSSESSTFSPGEHRVKIALPFLDNQYDTHILPPSLGEDVRYTVKVSTASWRINQLSMERDFDVTRFVDTWAREEFKAGFAEKLGRFGMTMSQRCFQRGKWIFCTIYGPAKAIRLSLIQQRRLRQPGLQSDASYCTERIVASIDSPDNTDEWPEEWALYIPPHITPSIEVSYWNVVVITYALQVISFAEDGHEHKHIVPVWIGCSDDKLGPPKQPAGRPIGDPGTKIVDPPLGELPEFEVVKPDPVHEHPFWVKRLNDDTYSEFPVV